MEYYVGIIYQIEKTWKIQTGNRILYYRFIYKHGKRCYTAIEIRVMPGKELKKCVRLQCF